MKRCPLSFRRKAPAAVLASVVVAGVALTASAACPLCPPSGLCPVASVDVANPGDEYDFTGRDILNGLGGWIEVADGDLTLIVDDPTIVGGAAAWKLRNSNSGAPAELFDLTTNPEERATGGLNLVGVSGLSSVVNSLDPKVDNWLACVTGNGPESTNCEPDNP